MEENYQRLARMHKTKRHEFSRAAVGKASVSELNYDVLRQQLTFILREYRGPLHHVS